MSQVKVIVTLKPSLLDAQGRVVQNALHSMGYPGVEQVRIGKYMELEIKTDSEAGSEKIEKVVKEMCDKLLSNPVIEDYSFEVVK